MSRQVTAAMGRSRVAEFSPLMLTIARESRRMSQSALAKAAHVTQSALSQIESGMFTPTSEVVHRLAAELRYPPTLFDVPLRFQQLPVSFFRKKARVGVRDVNAIRARVNLYRLRIEILMRSSELRDPRVALTDITREGLSPEAAAQRLRVYWNVAPGPVKDLTSVVEDAGILVVPLDFGSAAVDGLSLYEPNDNLPPMVFMNPNLSADRWRLTLCHELGHIVLHHHLSIPPDAKDMEAEAYRFAQEFLMPAREIAGHLGYLTMQRLAALKVHWRVSMRALVKRAEVLGRISDRQARRLWMQLSANGVTEPVSIAAETPLMLKGIVERHIAELGYSHRDISLLLHQDVDEFRSDFGIVTNHLRLT